MNRFAYLFCLNVLFLPFYRNVDGQIPERVLCVDENCSDIISTAITHLTYSKVEKYTLSFKANTKVNVLAKPKDKAEPLWGVEINGEYGFVPKDFLREQKVKNKHFQYELPGVDFLKLKNGRTGQKREKYTEKDVNFREEGGAQNSKIDAGRPSSYKDVRPPDELENVTESIVKSRKRKDDEPVEEARRPRHRKDDIDPVEYQIPPKIDIHDPGIESIDEINEQYRKYSKKSKITPQVPEEAFVNVSESAENTASVPTDNTIEHVASNEYAAENATDEVSVEDDEEDEEDTSENDDTEESVSDEDGLSEEVSSEASPEMVDLNDSSAADNISNEHTVSLEFAPKVESVQEKSSSLENVLVHDPLPEAANFSGDELNIDNFTGENATAFEPAPENIAYEKQDSIPQERVSENMSNDSSVVNATPEDDSKSAQLPETAQISQTVDHMNINRFAENPDNDTMINPGTQPDLQEFSHFTADSLNDSSVEYDIPLMDQSEFVVVNENIDTNDTLPESSIVLEEIVKTGENYISSNNYNPEVGGAKSGDSHDQTQSYKHYHDHQSAYSPPPPSHLPPQLPLFQSKSFDHFSDSNEQADDFDLKQPVIDNSYDGGYHGGNIETTPMPNPSESYPSSIVKDEEPTSSDAIIDKFDDGIIGDVPYDESKLQEDAPTSSSIISLQIFSDMYQSISNAFTNYNKDTSNDVMHSNDHSFLTENQDKTLMSSIFTGSSQCTLNDKQKMSWTDVSADLIFWLVTSAVSVLMFTLGYYYLDNKKEDGKLLAMVNTLQKDLLCSSKECILLKDELSITKEKLTGIEDNSFGSNEMVVCLKKELAEAESRISELQEKLAMSEEELANSTEAAFELQSILNEQLMANEKSNSLAFTITQLQSQLDDQQTTMNATKSQLAGKIEENEFLMMQISEVNKRCAHLQKEIDNTKESLSQAIAENENKSTQISELTSTLEKSIQHVQEQKNIEVRMIQLQLENNKTELNNLQATLKARIHEVQSLQDSMKALKTGDKNIDELLDVARTKADLVQLTSEKSHLTDKVENDQKVISELTENLNIQNSNIAKMKEQLVESENKALESTTRLEVLTNYFNQKEAELLKELSTKESLWISQQGEAMSTTERIESIQKEIQQYKDTAESMRRELAEQEAAWRAKAAALEQRAHDQWLARRAAERSAEASAREAQALRQRLAAPSPDKRVVSPLAAAGDALPDPAFMPPLGPLGPMLPPMPPLGFLPPPLGGPMMPPPLFAHRPAPLGRLSSPPPMLPPRSSDRDRYSDRDSRYSPDRAYSPGNRARSPFANSEERRRYNSRRYDDDRYYDSEEERRYRRYETETDFSPVNTLPPSPIPTPRNHKGVSSGSGRSCESTERFK